MEQNLNIESLIAENTELKCQLEEAQSLIEAIKDGAVDALVVNDNGKPTVYSLESADYTYRLLIEKCGEGALSISESGIILYCNEYFSTLVNVSADKLIGTFFISYIESVGKFNDLMANLSEGLSKGEVILNINGKKIPVYISLTNLRPTIPAIGIIVTDLSEKRKHEEDIVLYQTKLENKIKELNETNIKLEQFVHLISQNINEPIRRIFTYSSDLLNERIAAKQTSTLKTINSTAKRLNSFVSDLVKSRTNNPGNKTELDLKVIFDDVIEDMELIIKESDAKIIVRSMPIMSGFSIQLRQLFFNCIITLLKMLQSKGELIIDAEVADCVDFNIPNKKFHKINIVAKETTGFFSQKITPVFLMAKDPCLPTGVGSTICEKIMENHNGIIEFENMPGKEYSFHLYFPL